MTDDRCKGGRICHGATEFREQIRSVQFSSQESTHSLPKSFENNKCRLLLVVSLSKLGPYRLKRNFGTFHP